MDRKNYKEILELIEKKGKNHFDIDTKKELINLVESEKSDRIKRNLEEGPKEKWIKEAEKEDAKILVYEDWNNREDAKCEDELCTVHHIEFGFLSELVVDKEGVRKETYCTVKLVKEKKRDKEKSITDKSEDGEER